MFILDTQLKRIGLKFSQVISGNRFYRLLFLCSFIQTHLRPNTLRHVCANFTVLVFCSLLKVVIRLWTHNLASQIKITPAITKEGGIPSRFVVVNK